jgi:hypothetical protein
VEQVELGEFSKTSRLESFTKNALIQRLTLVEEEYHRAVKEIYRLKNQDLSDNQLRLVMNEKIEELRAALYGASTERYKKPVKPKESPPEPSKPRSKLPSERYPNVPVREQVIAMDPVPGCTSCGKQMSD